MPKDATKNVDRYKIKGGQLNEFDFQRNQEEFAEASKPEGNLIPGTPPEQRDGALPFLGKLIKKAGRRVGSAKGTKTTVKAAAKKSTKTAKAAKASKTGTVRTAAKKSTKTTRGAKASKTTKSMPRGATAKKLAARKAAKK